MVISHTTNKNKRGFPRGTFVFWIIIVVITVLVSMAVVYKFSKMGGGSNPRKAPKIVSTQTLQPQPIHITYATQGTIEARYRIDMNMEVAGTVVRINVEEGESVKKNKILLHLRALRQGAEQQESIAAKASAKAFLNARKAEVSEARANILSAQSAKELATSEHQRYEALYQDGFVSALERDQKRLAFQQESARLKATKESLERTRAQQEQAKAQYDEAKAHVELNRAAINETIIRAPFGGVIGEKYVDVGDYVLPSEKILTLVDNQKLKVAFKVPERFIGYLKNDLPVKITLNEVAKASLKGNQLLGHVIFISPTVNPETRMVTVKAKISSEDSNLRDGQFTHVVLTLLTKPEGLLIPEETLVPQGEKFFVYLSKNKKAVFQEVKLGHRETGWVEVIQGLKAGDELVTTGLQNLFEGATLVKKETNSTQANPTQLNADGT